MPGRIIFLLGIKSRGRASSLLPLQIREYDFLPNIRERERRAVFLVNRAACATVYVHREATCALILGIKNGVENEILVTSRDSINLAKIAID